MLFLSFISACSELGERGGNKNSGNDPYADITESSLTYFSNSIGDTVLFTVNQSSLTSDAREILTSQVEWIKENGVNKVTIEGHADEQGTREYNLALGARRATAVRNYLVSQGISEDILSVVTYGKERPLKICSEESCWSKNRRSVTAISGESAS
jgi:peptidoglycan-associated lipoprotein